MIDKITPWGLLRFTFPSIMLMVFISIYTAADSVLIARMVGPEALAGLNIVLPLYSIAFACGIMFASGGGAIMAIKLGRKQHEEAGRNFSSLIIVGAGFGSVAAVLCLLFRGPLIAVLGGVGGIGGYAETYGKFMMITFPFMIMKVIIESVLRVDGAPGTALLMTIAGGIINILLDLLFMGPFQMGIAGAGLGTLLAIILSLPVGIYHFLFGESKLKFILSAPDPVFLRDTVVNGSSEMVNEAAIGLTTVVFNLLAVGYLGEDGLSAVAIIMGLNFINSSVIFGFTTGVSPLISYNYGRGELTGLNKIIRISMIFILLCSASCFLINFIAAGFIVGVFVEKGTSIYLLAFHGLRLYSICFLFTGIDLFGSAFFTAFGNGRISALISFIKSFLVFPAAAIILPVLFGSDGIWFIRPVTQLVAVIPVMRFMRKYQKRYGYSLGCVINRPGRLKVLLPLKTDRK